MIDSAVADAAFALKEGETSAPIKGMFGTMLVHVVKIEPENVKPFEEVAAEIKQTIATDRARSEIAARSTTRSRTSAPAARGSPKSRRSSISRPARSRRSTARAAIRTASRSAASRRRQCHFQRIRLGCRRRERAAADGGRRLCLVRGARREAARASARSTRCARRSSSAGVKSQVSEAAEGQGGPRSSTS